MRVGINIVYWKPKGTGGLETMLRGLLPAIAEIAGSVPGVTIFLLGTEENLAALEGVGASIGRVAVATRWSGIVSRLWCEHVEVARAAKRLELDVVHTMNYFGPLFVPCRSIVSLLDMNYRAVPETFTAATRLVRGALTTLSCANASAVVTGSRFSKGEIEKYLAPAAPIFPIYLGPAPELLAARAAWPDGLPLEKPYFFSAGTSFVHKNFHGLVHAYDRYRAEAVGKRVAPADLYIAGQLRSGADELRAAIAASPNNASIRLLGPVTASELRALYERALGFVFPSLYEGFGIPPLEAMALGCPVVCSNAASLPEIVGDAALLVDARNGEELASAMLRLHDGEIRRRLVGKGTAHVARFSWAEAARRVLDVYLTVGSKRSHAAAVSDVTSQPNPSRRRPAL